MTRVARPLNRNLMAYRLDAPMPQGFTATTQGLDESMAYGRSNGATIQADVLDTIQESCHQGPNDAIDKCYNDKVSEKVIMQIKR